MSMSRKDYRAFADMLADQRKLADSRAEHLLLDEITANMARIFKSDNGRFSPDTFRTAAGYDSPAAEAARVEPSEQPVAMPHSSPEHVAAVRRQSY